MSNKLLMGNRDVRQIYDKQWTVTVVDQVHDISALLQGSISTNRSSLRYDSPHRKFLLFSLSPRHSVTQVLLVAAMISMQLKPTHATNKQTAQNNV